MEIPDFRSFRKPAFRSAASSLLAAIGETGGKHAQILKAFAERFAVLFVEQIVQRGLVGDDGVDQLGVGAAQGPGR